MTRFAIISLNPICEKCFIIQIKYWLIDINASSFAREIILNKIKKELSVETLNEIECIICKNEKVAFCSYCFFFKVIRVFKEFNFDNELAKDFQDIFNYKPNCFAITIL